MLRSFSYRGQRTDTARIETTECAAYEAPQPPLPYVDANTYEEIGQGTLAYDYVRSTHFGGVRAAPRPGRAANVGDSDSVEIEGSYVI